MNSDYKQCKLARKTEQGKVETTSWLPLQFAKKSKVLKLQDRDSKEWTDGWVVKKVYAIRLKEEEVLKREDDYRTQRETSDV